MTNVDVPARQAEAASTTAGSSGLGLTRPATAGLLALLAVGLLAPIWTVRYPALLDYPNHLASAFVLAHLKDAAFHFSTYYASDWNTYPYLAMDAILVGLQRFVSIDIAGRLLLSLCVLSVPAAAWFFLRQANPSEKGFALWSLLVANNMYFFIFAFLNQQLSMTLCFFLLGLWLWQLNRPRPATWCLLLLVTTALYFSHLEGFAVAAAVMTAYLWSAKRPMKDMLYAWALYIPGALFYVHIMASHSTLGAIHWRKLTDKIGSLVSVMVGCSPILDLLTLLILIGVLAWVQIDNREFKWNYAWRRSTMILFLFYWLLPAAFGRATNADKRLLPFVFVLSLAGARVGRRGRKLALIAVLLFLVRAGVLERHFVSLQPHLTKLAGAISAIPPGARVLPLVDWANGQPIPERHFWAYGVIERGWFSPCLLHFPGVQPFAIIQPTYNPCGLPITSPSDLDWGRIQSEFDYVWAYRVPQISPALSSAGTVVLEDGDLKILKVGTK